MSTTVSGPFTPVVRRMIPSGSVNADVPTAGVCHPSTQLAVAGPFVGGGTAGVAGGVTEAAGDSVGEADGDGVTMA
jgi:hypothetical protein